MLNGGTDWLHLDVDAVDAELFQEPLIDRVQFEQFTMNAGDCAFIPYSYLHHVVTNKNIENERDDALQV